MSKAHPRCAVVGAANIDIGGFPSGAAVMRDSNPGRIRMSAGGVGRNIACNLARLGVETQLVTALGGDAFADVIRADCASAGVRLDHALTLSDAASSSYLFIADDAGDMLFAVNDMSICERLTPEALAPVLDALNAMDAVVLDANLSGEALRFLAENVRAPLIADAVSTVKARKLIPILPYLRAIKPNAIEAAALTGLPVKGRESGEAAARRLVEMGARRAFITLGELGVCAWDRTGGTFIPGRAVRMVNATGAGDAFTAALAWAEIRGMTPRDAAVAGLAAASIAIEAEATVSPEITEDRLLRRMAECP